MKDSIFAQSDSPAVFRFDHQVASVFDDMLCRSVPFYDEVIRMTGQILSTFLQPGDRIYDLGCSTGTCTLALAQRFSGMDIDFIGIDTSPEMLAKANQKLADLKGPLSCRFMDGDLADVPMENAGAVIINYTLQFIKPDARLKVLQRIHLGLRPGGVLILSEKIAAGTSDISNRFTDFYHDFKRMKGYSEMEISKKREALENVLVPLSLQKNLGLLAQAGFPQVETFFQWFNFVSILAIKT